MLQACIRALMSFKEEDHQVVINLVSDIYNRYGVHSDIAKKIFKQLPTVTDNKIKQLTKEFCGSTEKKQRQLMRKFLQPVIGANSGTFKRAQTILKLPNLAATNIQNAK
jgi:truncated hemoglobin YjbI